MVATPLDQERARRASNDVRGVLQNMSPKRQKEYRSLARDFPAMVQSMGLGQAMAFLLANAGKEDKPHGEFAKHVAEWLLDAKCTAVPLNVEPREQANGRTLLDKLVESAPHVWWHADSEAIAFGWWLKRFAEAEISDSKANQGRKGSTPGATPAQET
jgi:CRISPR type III-B/RAMP module-associated protein Cmr5